MPKRRPRFRGTTPEIERAARRLRNQLTPAEKRLWNALKNRQLAGLKFRCQHPVGQFILDFYCPAKRLVIEVDGITHDLQQAYDTQRTVHLEQFGYRVIRFHNLEIINNLQVVLARIKQTAELQ
ncbi:MAG: endonuclease domain-containing protein [Cyanobacteria bacterium J06631_9]